MLITRAISVQDRADHPCLRQQAQRSQYKPLSGNLDPDSILTTLAIGSAVILDLETQDSVHTLIIPEFITEFGTHPRMQLQRLGVSRRGRHRLSHLPFAHRKRSRPGLNDWPSGKTTPSASKIPAWPLRSKPLSLTSVKRISPFSASRSSGAIIVRGDSDVFHPSELRLYVTVLRLGRVQYNWLAGLDILLYCVVGRNGDEDVWGEGWPWGLRSWMRLIC